MVFSEILKQYGDEATLHLSGTDMAAKVFIQPILSNRLDRRWREMTNLGERDTSRFYYFGPADAEIADYTAAVVTCGNKTYRFLKAEPFRVEGKVSHWEGILELREALFDGGA